MTNNSQSVKQYVDIAALYNWDKNPRTVEREAIERLKKQLLKLGQYKPLIVCIENDRYIVLGGNMRLIAMRELAGDGKEEFLRVWISKVDAPTEQQKLEYALSDNDRAGKYDEEKLMDLVHEVPDLDLDGYTIDSRESYLLSDVADRYLQTEEDDFDADKEAEAIESPVSKRGDVFILGDHVLMCGDATSLEDSNKLMGGVKAQMVFTDPPYNVDYSGHGKKTSNKILNDKMDGGSFRTFLRDTFATYRIHVADDAPMYVCYADMNHRTFEDTLEENGFKTKAKIVWVKNIASMGWGDYRWKHEPILYASIEGKKVPFYGARKEYTVWEDKPTDQELLIEAKRLLQESEDEHGTTVWTVGRDGDYEHPTQKPLRLVEIALANSSKQGDCVLDLFGGSGSTLMACEQTGRACRTMELDPRYCDVIIGRWERFTGLKAVKQ